MNDRRGDERKGDGVCLVRGRRWSDIALSKEERRQNALSKKEREGKRERREIEGKSASPNTNRFESSNQLLRMSCAVYIAFARTTKIF